MFANISMKEADHSNVKMKWFAGNSSTNAEGKFEYQEPKLLRVSRITEEDKKHESSAHLGNHDDKETEATGTIL